MASGYTPVPGRAGGLVDRHLEIAVLSCVLATGCMAGDASGAWDTGASLSETDSGEDEGDTYGDSGYHTPEAAWFRLGATLALSEGVPEDVLLELEFFDEAEVLIECTEARVASAVLVSTTTPDPLIYHWFRVSVAPPDATCTSPGELPDELHLGLGALHPEVAARLLSRGLEGVSDSLYGAYVLLEDDQLELDAADQLALAYGYAGTTADFDGDTTAVSEAPLPDGDYAISGVFLFPLQDPRVVQ